MTKEKCPYTVDDWVKSLISTVTPCGYHIINRLTALDYMFNSRNFSWDKGRLIQVRGQVNKPEDIKEEEEIIEKTTLKEDFLSMISPIWRFTSLTPYCALYNLPDNIKSGYLKVARELYDLMWESPEYVSGQELLPAISNRLKFLEEKQRRLQARREEQRKNFYNNWFGKNIIKWPEVENFTLPNDEVERKKVLKRKKDYLEKKAHYAHLEKQYGISNYFNNTVKIEYNDAMRGFYRRRISPFTCTAFSTTKTTQFTLHTIDDSSYTAGFTRILPREEATPICREFMRTIPHKGLKVKDFVEFFKNKGADYWDLEGNFEGDNEIRFEVVKE